VKSNTPGDDGVPDIVLPVRIRPSGSIPDATDQVYGGVPPLAVKLCGEYAEPTVPLGKDKVEMERGVPGPVQGTV